MHSASASVLCRWCEVWQYDVMYVFRLAGAPQPDAAPGSRYIDSCAIEYNHAHAREHARTSNATTQLRATPVHHLIIIMATVFYFAKSPPSSRLGASSLCRNNGRQSCVALCACHSAQAGWFGGHTRSRGVAHMHACAGTHWPCPHGAKLNY